MKTDDGGPPIDILVDFLMSDDAQLQRNRPHLVENFAVIKGSGVRLALSHCEWLDIEGRTPTTGGMNRVRIAVASIPAILAMKGHAIQNRAKQKDAYDIYYCIRNFPGGARALARECMPLLRYPQAVEGYRNIDSKFRAVDWLGPTSVMQFAVDQGVLHFRTPEQWRQDAFGQVDEWLRNLNIRS